MAYAKLEEAYSNVHPNIPFYSGTLMQILSHQSTTLYYAALFQEKLLVLLKYSNKIQIFQTFRGPREEFSSKECIGKIPGITDAQFKPIYHLPGTPL